MNPATDFLTLTVRGRLFLQGFLFSHTPPIAGKVTLSETKPELPSDGSDESHQSFVAYTGKSNSSTAPNLLGSSRKRVGI